MNLIATDIGTFVLGSAIGLTVKNAIDIAVMKYEIRGMKGGKIQSD